MATIVVIGRKVYRLKTPRDHAAEAKRASQRAQRRALLKLLKGEAEVQMIEGGQK